MASSVQNLNFRLMFYSMIFIIINLKYFSRADKLAPAMFVFGDSLVDVGNNNHLPLSILKANYPHNGIDYPNHKATGRFSNGKNAADLLAEKLGMESSPPPYLSLTKAKSSNFSTGVSFASGGAGIFDGNDQLYRQSIPLNKQVDYYGIVQAKIMQQMGQTEAQKLLSKSVFTIVIGSNDIFGYFGSSNSTQKKKGMSRMTPQQYVASMVLAFSGQLKRIYDLGGRKFVILGVAAVGCCPSQRNRNKTEACNEAANFGASSYNKGLISALQDYQTQFKDFQYTYFDTYSIFVNLVQQPATYGFKDAETPCCGGVGDLLHDKIACLPFSSYCSNRSDHVFWDLYHPTEATDHIIVEALFNGPRNLASPVNVKQLVST